MYKIRKINIIVVFILFSAFCILCTGCSPKKQIYAKKISTYKLAAVDIDDKVITNKTYENAYYEFIDKIYPNIEKGENTVISPLSIYIALGMLTNGANGDSLKELEGLLGLSVSDINSYCSNLFSYYNEVNKGTVSTANSFWINENRLDREVKQQFLDINSYNYGADIYKDSFNNKTLNDINNWIFNHTDGMIDKILDSIDPEMLMYIINTVLFDGKWPGNERYRDHDFTDYLGNKKKADFMFGESSCLYKCDSVEAIGFTKAFKSESGSYAFFGILPNDLDSFVNSNMLGTNINKLFNSRVYNIGVQYCFPKFEYSYDLDVKELLVRRGIDNIFDKDKANFSNMYNLDEGNNVFVDMIKHKAKITVSKDGVKASAATVIGMNDTSISPKEEIVFLYLDKPFVYCVMDMTNGIPLFVGTVDNI